MFLVAAVVAALTTPLVVAATRGTDTSTGPTAPSSTEAAHVRLEDVSVGQPPRVDWIDGRDYVAADGTRTTLPFDHVVRAAPYRGTFLVMVYGDPHLIWLDRNLSGGARWCGHGSLSVSRDSGSTAFAVSKPTTGCKAGGHVTLHLGPSSPSSAPDQIRPMPTHDAALVGILGNAIVVSPYNQGSPALLAFDGTSTAIGELSHAEGVDARLGLVSGQLAGGRVTRLTGAVVNPATGSVSWTKPGWQLFTFSPDGSMVLGVQTASVGRPLAWGVFDAESGKQLHAFKTPAGLSFRTVIWEDDEHLLMTTTQGHSQAILRSTLDGAIQLATEAVPFDGDTQDIRYALAPNAFP